MRTALALIFALASITAAHSRTPEEVVRAYYDGMRDSDETAVARLFHPDDLREFRATNEPLIRNALRSAGNRMGFSGFVDPYEPKKMRAFSDEDFMATFIRWAEQWQAQSLDYFKKAEIDVIGHVPEANLQHVVVHMILQRKKNELQQRIVITTKDFEGEPMLELTGDIKGLAAALAPLGR